MKITYVGPFDAVEVDGFGVVARGAVVDVPDALAGRPPVPRVEAAHEELRAATEAHDHELAKALREEIIGLDHGVGLLAQVGCWEAAAKTQPAPAEEAKP